VGSFLNVHEGPQNFSQVLINNPFEPGMVTTIEPGVYLENRYGIRTENMLLTVEDGTTNHGKWLKFETISFCPIDREAIVVDMLSDEQLKWINNYHQQVYAKISQRLNAEENKVLKIMTAELVR
ncbi:MAG: M24 family metallopeptidase, partial [Candidatus Cloacimonetes bacterium]|nr:M24 family metallopeptidase [Candidatus Cloacimonadota bacterium]